MKRTLRIVRGYYLITRGRAKLALARGLRALANFIRAAHDPATAAAKAVRCLRWSVRLVFVASIIWWGWAKPAVGRVLPFAFVGYLTGRVIDRFWTEYRRKQMDRSRASSK